VDYSYKAASIAIDRFLRPVCGTFNFLPAHHDMALINGGSALVPQTDRGSGVMAEQKRGSGRRILQSGAWLFLPKTTSAVLSLIYLAVSTQSLGAAEFGKFMLIFSFAQTISSWHDIGAHKIRSKAGRTDMVLPDP
jgi:hypothetical protein